MHVDFGLSLDPEFNLGICIFGVKAASNASLPENWLEQFFNYYRQSAGLSPVVKSVQYSADLAKHVSYMLLNVPTEGLWHGETPGRPGYTVEGAQAAGESNLWFPGVYATPAVSIDVWMGSIHDRYGMLRPDLVTTGFGFGCDAQNCGTGLNVIRGLDWGINAKPNGVIYPGQNQINVNRDITLTWQFISDSTVVLKSASLRISPGRSFQFRRQHRQPATSSIWFLDPTSSFAYGTMYTANVIIRLGADQLHRTWSFTTEFDPNAFTYTITGNAGVSGANISYTGGSTFSDGSGNYLIPVSAGWSGTVTPIHPCYSFSPGIAAIQT